MAQRQVDPEWRKTYQELETRWLRLAFSYEFADRLNQYTANLACALDQQKKK
jgi:hypothetical protein